MRFEWPQQLHSNAARQVKQQMPGSTDGANPQCAAKSQWRKRFFRNRRPSRIFSIERAKYARQGASHQRRTCKGMQHRAMKSNERVRSAEIAQVIEIGRDTGNDQHRRAETRQAALSRACKGQRS